MKKKLFFVLFMSSMFVGQSFANLCSFRNKRDDGHIANISAALKNLRAQMIKCDPAIYKQLDARFNNIVEESKNALHEQLVVNLNNGNANGANCSNFLVLYKKEYDYALDSLFFTDAAYVNSTPNAYKVCVQKYDSLTQQAEIQECMSLLYSARVTKKERDCVDLEEYVDQKNKLKIQTGLIVNTGQLIDDFLTRSDCQTNPNAKNLLYSNILNVVGSLAVYFPQVSLYGLATAAGVRIGNSVLQNLVLGDVGKKLDQKIDALRKEKMFQDSLSSICLAQNRIARCEARRPAPDVTLPAYSKSEFLRFSELESLWKGIQSGANTTLAKIEELERREPKQGLESELSGQLLDDELNKLLVGTSLYQSSSNLSKVINRLNEQVIPTQEGAKLSFREFLEKFSDVVPQKPTQDLVIQYKQDPNLMSDRDKAIIENYVSFYNDEIKAKGHPISAVDYGDLSFSVYKIQRLLDLTGRPSDNDALSLLAPSIKERSAEDKIELLRLINAIDLGKDIKFLAEKTIALMDINKREVIGTLLKNEKSYLDAEKILKQQKDTHKKFLAEGPASPELEDSFTNIIEKAGNSNCSKKNTASGDLYCSLYYYMNKYKETADNALRNPPQKGSSSTSYNISLESNFAHIERIFSYCNNLASVFHRNADHGNGIFNKKGWHAPKEFERACGDFACYFPKAYHSYFDRFNEYEDLDPRELNYLLGDLQCSMNDSYKIRLDRLKNEYFTQQTVCDKRSL